MIQLLLFASIPAAIAVSTIEEASGDRAVTMKANGEFLAKNYPPRALKAGQQGKVGFRLVVEPDGSLGSCDVTQSSGFEALDDETCEIILRNARLPVVRDADGRSVRAVQNGFINWKHPGIPGKAAAVKTASAGQTPDKIICRKSSATGSLIKRTKQCMTSREWSETQRIQRERAYDIIGKGHNEEGHVCTLPSGLPC